VRRTPCCRAYLMLCVLRRWLPDRELVVVGDRPCATRPDIGTLSWTLYKVGSAGDARLGVFQAE